MLQSIIRIHELELASLYELRRAHLNSPHVNLHRLARLDDRISGHIGGLRLASQQTYDPVSTELDESSASRVFAVALRKMQKRGFTSLDSLWAVADENADVRDGLISSFEWIDRCHLRDIVRDLISSDKPARRTAGIAVSAMHQAALDLRLGFWVRDSAPDVRSRALHAAGELGHTDLTNACMLAIACDDNVDCVVWAAWSAVVLGDRASALDALALTALTAGSLHRSRAFRLALQALGTSAGHSILQELAKDPGQLQWLIQGSGLVGDPRYVPWLVSHMQKPELARVAGEAFTLITGADLDTLQLYRPQPEGFAPGPNDDPNDPSVDMDPDEGLMWPDPVKVERWWAKNAGGFQKGTRYFMGQPVTREHCIDVLKNGYQRQRILAAHYLCLLEPGTPLFNTSAPAWRQQRLLATM